MRVGIALLLAARREKVFLIKLYELHNPELNLNVRYKILSPTEIDLLLVEHSSGSRDQFMQAVLENVIHNLRTEVTTALRKLPKDQGKMIINSLFTGALMLNPGLDVDSWQQICSIFTISPSLISAQAGTDRYVSKVLPRRTRTARSKINKAKIVSLESHLKARVIGQDEVIEDLVRALKRSQAGLADATRPLGVFLLCGPSGSGKSYLAKELHKSLYGTDYDLVRVDCGEYQHKHENQKLIGSPNGYLGYDEGGQLTNSIIKHPQSVVLLDEVEKAHPDIWNTFLRVFDEGTLTSGNGEEANFRESIIIMTSNLGNADVVRDLTDRSYGFGGNNNNNMPNRDRVIRLAQESIRKQFSPEFLNRIDKTFVFNHLTSDDYLKIAALELDLIRSKLEKRGFSLLFDSTVLDAMVQEGVSHVQGARGLAQLRRDRIENPLAETILAGRHPKGTAFVLAYEANDYCVTVQRPGSKSARSKERPSSSNVVVSSP